MQACFRWERKRLRKQQAREEAQQQQQQQQQIPSAGGAASRHTEAGPRACCGWRQWFAWILFVVITSGSFLITLMMTSKGLMEMKTAEPSGLPCGCQGVTRNGEAEWLELLLSLIVLRTFVTRPCHVMAATLLYHIINGRCKKGGTGDENDMGGQEGGDEVSGIVMVAPMSSGTIIRENPLRTRSTGLSSEQCSEQEDQNDAISSEAVEKSCQTVVCENPLQRRSTALSTGSDPRGGEDKVARQLAAEREDATMRRLHATYSSAGSRGTEADRIASHRHKRTSAKRVSGIKKKKIEWSPSAVSARGFMKSTGPTNSNSTESKEATQRELEAAMTDIAENSTASRGAVLPPSSGDTVAEGTEEGAQEYAGDGTVFRSARTTSIEL